MRALVVSGGGSKGAFAGGVAEYLLQACNFQYDLFVGVSTGSLLVPLLALGEIDRLRELYTNVNQKDIFSTCPVRVRRQKDGSFRTRIHHANIVKMFIRGRKTFGESFHLRELIDRNLTEADYQRLIDLPKEVLVTVSNLSTQEVEFKNQHSWRRKDFLDWMWLSANLIPFMSLGEKNGYLYADGGIGTHLPLQEAIHRGVSEIDAIVQRPPRRSMIRKTPSNVFGLLMETFDFALNQISYKDEALANCQGALREVQIRYYYTPDHLTDNPLIFDRDQMQTWWKEGYEHAQKTNPYCQIVPPNPPSSR
ncbi:MAG: patatin-like phospholipase family protein [Bacteroidota bacterium]